MLVFSTRFPLKNSACANELSELFSEWITGSQHYNVNLKDLEYDEESTLCYSCKKEKISIEMRHYNDENKLLEFLSCRLINTEEDALWITDYIFVSDNGEKTLLVQLDCNNLEYNDKLKRSHKPHIIKMCFKKGFCGSDAGIPVSDKPLYAENYLEECVKIMSGKSDNTMPVIYVSYDSFNDPAVDPVKLARDLSGTAHVFVEQRKNTSFYLKNRTKNRNVHSGYFGIYYPKSEFRKIFNPEHYTDSRKLEKDIISNVHQSLINRSDAVSYSWDQIENLQARQKISQWKDISDSTKEEMNDIIKLSDNECSKLSKRIEELNYQNRSLQAQVDTLQETVRKKNIDSGLLISGKETELYYGEIVALLVSILSQAQYKYENNSRAYTLVKSLLAANHPNNKCKNIVETVKKVFSTGEKLDANRKKQLEDVGFSVTADKNHYKIIFYNDPRYTFSVSKTPSDHREGKNLASDINKIIDVERKVL